MSIKIINASASCDFSIIREVGPKNLVLFTGYLLRYCLRRFLLMNLDIMGSSSSVSIRNVPMNPTNLFLLNFCLRIMVYIIDVVFSNSLSCCRVYECLRPNLSRLELQQLYQPPIRPPQRPQKSID